MKKEKKLTRNNFKIIFGFAIIFLVCILLVSATSNVVNLVPEVFDYLIEVNMGHIPGQKMEHWFGDNDAVGTSEEDIWGNGGTLFHLFSAETMDIISTDTTNDISTGSNAREIIIIGLDENFIEMNETVTLTASGNTTTQQFLRVFRMYVTKSGEYGNNNAGKITATASTNATVQSSIEIAEGQSTTTHYTVPAGKTAYMLRTSITMQTGKEVHVHINIRENANDTSIPFTALRKVHHWEGLDVPVQEKFDANHRFKEKTDIWFAGSVTTGSAIIQANYDLLVADN